MKMFVANILFLLLAAAPLTASAQYQYMFDKRPDKVKHKHSIKKDIEMLKINADEYKKMRKEAKEDRKVSRQTMSRTYKIQTRKVRRRMMASRCEAAHFNGDHHFWCEPLHMFFRHGDAIPIKLRQNKCKMSAKK